MFAFLFVSLPLFLSFLPLFYLFAPAFCPFVLLCFGCLLLVLSCLPLLSLCPCGSLCVGGVAFSLSDYTQKERARRVGASSLVLLWVVLAFVLPFGYSAASGITKLFVAVSILNELPEIQATEN